MVYVNVFLFTSLSLQYAQISSSPQSSSLTRSVRFLISINEVKYDMLEDPFLNPSGRKHQ